MLLRSDTYPCGTRFSLCLRIQGFVLQDSARCQLPFCRFWRQSASNQNQKQVYISFLCCLWLTHETTQHICGSSWFPLGICYNFLSAPLPPRGAPPPRWSRPPSHCAMPRTADRDVVVFAGDTLFFKDFDLQRRRVARALVVIFQGRLGNSWRFHGFLASS